jgi:hypothetical protein
VLKWCKRNNNLNYIETSAKNDTNIDDAFIKITELAVEYDN